LKYQLRTEILINASPGKVWSVLTDFEKYPEWNPFIKFVKGNPIAGEKISVRLEPPDEKGMTISPKVLKVDYNREFRWKGQLFIPGLFDGEHIFELKDNVNGTTTFIHRENFSGILIGFFKKMLEGNTKKGFEMMKEKLKEISEK
jgi:hypothetical protein